MATKRSTAQNADYVPGHIIGQFRKLGIVKGAPWVGSGFTDDVEGQSLIG
jgi:hypothetical protein